jgi:uncharacterized protein
MPPLAVAALSIIGRVVAFLLVALFLQIAASLLLAAVPNPIIVATVSVFVAGLAANYLAALLFDRQGLGALGLGWGGASAHNLGLGVASGVAAAALVVLGPAAVGAASFEPSEAGSGEPYLLMALFLLAGAAGEELLFRGFAFQVLLRALGPWATILPTAVLFAALHAGNPNVTRVALVNTALWGAALGYALWRSHDFWLPIGLHFGWNVTLPLVGVPLSGFTIKAAGYQVSWHIGSLWSGGSYGPEAGLLTTLLVPAVVLFLAKAPVARQRTYLLDAAQAGPDQPAPEAAREA